MTKTFKSAIIIMPPDDISGISLSTVDTKLVDKCSIQEIRKEHDRVYDRWMPHINLMYPFVIDTEFPEVEKKIQEALKDIKPFEIKLKEFDYFKHGKSATLWLKPETVNKNAIKEIHEALIKVFPTFNELSSKSEKGYAGHLTVANCKNETKAKKLKKELEGIFDPITFIVNNIYLISRQGDDDPFKIICTIPLGTSLTSTGTSLTLTRGTSLTGDTMKMATSGEVKII